MDDRRFPGGFTGSGGGEYHPAAVVRRSSELHDMRAMYEISSPRGTRIHCKCPGMTAVRKLFRGRDRPHEAGPPDCKQKITLLMAACVPVETVGTCFFASHHSKNGRYFAPGCLFSGRRVGRRARFPLRRVLVHALQLLILTNTRSLSAAVLPGGPVQRFRPSAAMQPQHTTKLGEENQCAYKRSSMSP
jgi:hypothetical protein